MHHAGIKIEEQLRELGAVRAYVMVKRAGGNASLNLLWALEGALTNSFVARSGESRKAQPVASSRGADVSREHAF